jgi:hypothetical protein
MFLIYILPLIFTGIVIVLLYFFIKKPNNNSDNNSYNNYMCNQTLTPCTDGNCINCSNDFECVDVEESDNYNFNGGKVPKGSYCLPKRQEWATCNRYTGRWVWSAKDSKQTWTCECLYPNLFANKDGGDCTKQTENCTLVGKNGETWDPLNGTDPNVLEMNPYKIDENGDPYFNCECKENTIVLPSDPYVCNENKCFLKGAPPNSPIKVDSTGKVTSCNCEKGGGTGMYTVPEGINQGTCFIASDACGTGNTWNESTNRCECGNTGCPVICNNGLGVSGEINNRAEEIMCQVDNPAGRMCYNMCDENLCNSVGTNRCSPNCDTGISSFTCSCKQGYTRTSICEKDCIAPGGEVVKSSKVCHDVCDGEDPPYCYPKCTCNGFEADCCDPNGISGETGDCRCR